LVSTATQTEGCLPQSRVPPSLVAQRSAQFDLTEMRKQLEESQAECLRYKAEAARARQECDAAMRNACAIAASVRHEMGDVIRAQAEALDARQAERAEVHAARQAAMTSQSMLDQQDLRQSIRMLQEAVAGTRADAASSTHASARLLSREMERSRADMASSFQERDQFLSCAIERSCADAERARHKDADEMKQLVREVLAECEATKSAAETAASTASAAEATANSIRKAQGIALSRLLVNGISSSRSLLMFWLSSAASLEFLHIAVLFIRSLL
jgi:hypothetical protein